MKRAFICNIVPNNLVNQLNSPQAPNNFCFNLIENNCFDSVYSIVPNSYSDVRIESDKAITYVLGRKRKTKIGVLLYNIICNVRCILLASKSDNIWFYNIVNANVLCFVILRYVFKKKVYVILLDHTPSDNKLSLQYFIPYFISNSYGVISLSSRSDINHTNMEYIAGIIPVEKIQKDAKDANDKLRFLFSGILGKHTGFDLAIEVFKQLPNCELYVTGFGELSSLVKENYENIHYLGYLSYDEYIQLYDKVDVCLSFRNPEFLENKNNFPSKILEYFSYNKIVISTINYPELKDFNFFSCKYDLESVKNTINRACNMEKKQLKIFSCNSKALENNFSEIKWIDAFTKIEMKSDGKNP